MPENINLYASVLHLACEKARTKLGSTYPNPPVGAAALDSEGNLLALACHEKAGGPHAETALISLCRHEGLLSRLDTLCVTLEPCNHQGRTAPCTDAIIAAGFKKIVIGARDPNPHVHGGGAQKLREAGLFVYEIASPECQHLIHAFEKSVTTGAPWITVKRAFTLEGSMIPPLGQKTFTSPQSLTLAHRLRKKSDAIITGSGTILADHPQFTVRHVQDYSNTSRILAIVDRRHRVGASYLDEVKKHGLVPILYSDLDQCVKDLGTRNIRDVLVEAGPTLSEAILGKDLWSMSLTITSPQHGGSDIIDVSFNPRQSSFLTGANFNWEYFLPP